MRSIVLEAILLAAPDGILVAPLLVYPPAAVLAKHLYFQLPLPTNGITFSPNAQRAAQVDDMRHNTEAAEKRTTKRPVNKGREVIAPADPESGILGQAVQAGDYQKFRTGLVGYEEPLRRRVGRWIQRYPE